VPHAQMSRLSRRMAGALRAVRRSGNKAVCGSPADAKPLPHDLHSRGIALTLPQRLLHGRRVRLQASWIPMPGGPPMHTSSTLASTKVLAHLVHRSVTHGQRYRTST
jgi:hypothetical protein